MLPSHSQPLTSQSSSATELPTEFIPWQRYLLPVFIVLLLLVGLLAMTRSLQKTIAASGAIDLHPYWYYGHFVRDGINPYMAFASKLALPEAVHYWNGTVVAPDKVQQPRLAIIPANTASTLWLSSLLAFFPWYQVKYIWFVSNLVLILATPWLALRLLPPSLRLSRGLQWVIALAFYALKGQRVALTNGQPSVFIFLLMIVTLLLYRRHWLWAGLALGVALGKYSISAPIVLFLLFDKQWRTLIVAFGVQLISLLGISALKGGSPWQTAQVLWGMIAHYSDGQPGVHLSYLLRNMPALAMGLVVLGTLITLVIFFLSWRRGWLAADLVPVNSFLALWTLLAAYHRVYDTMLALLILILCLSAATTWRLPRYQSWSLGFFFVACVVILCLPGELVDLFLPSTQADAVVAWFDRTIIVTLVVMWAVNMWLMAKTPRLDS